MNSAEKSNEQYQVVALKYRPQTFGDLIGQDHIASALSNAIKQDRIGHAYLFTGARGVGKTSSARIFAKCLNCVQGPTTSPCNECDICQAVSVGEDVDVLEIDGASNRGIDEIRQLRSNASVRPSRARFKIYIIDEVHMLTTPAFNALLKTLEEPPPHVKFIFCTTDPQKIPITVLSRCQRFDFSPVQTDEIASSLKAIAQQENVKADDQALALLARRANGSMRDSQSLLEQLLSFCDDRITVEDVNQLLGTADVGRIAELATSMTERDTTATLNGINQAILDGVNAGQLATQLLGYFRDVMTVRVGCGEDTLLTCTGTDLESLRGIADRLGLETTLTIVQILDNAVVRMQSSLHARTLLEVAAIRICNLENLDSISDLVQQLSSASSEKAPPSRAAPRRQKVELKKVSAPSKKNEITDGQTASESAVTTSGPPDNSPRNSGAPRPSIADPSPSIESPQPKTKTFTSGQDEATASADGPAERLLSATELKRAWQSTLEQIGDMTADLASDFENLELVADDRLEVTFKEGYRAKECSKPERRQKIETTLESIAGRRIHVAFKVSPQTGPSAKSKPPRLSRAQQIRKLHEDDFVKQTMSLFDAEITNYFELSKQKK